MKRIVVIISLMLAAVLFAGCAAQASGTPGLNKPVTPSSTKYPIGGPIEPINPGDLISDDLSNISEALFWDYMRLGGTSEEAVAYKIFTSYAEFAKEFGGSVDQLERTYDERSFNKAFVIAVYITTRTGGYTFSLESSLVKNSTVTIGLSSELADGAHTQAFERHVVLVGFDRSVYSDGLTVKIEGVSDIVSGDKI